MSRFISRPKIDDLQSVPNVSVVGGSVIQGTVLGEMAIKCGLDNVPPQIIDIGNGQLTMPYNSVVFINVDSHHRLPMKVNITCQSK